ncbi:MAG TPA: tetratricopeptide repeat protein [Bacteroidia bacterium]|nr:tetratricopeptide repeat protein [Bacteroidia bacterium]
MFPRTFSFPLFIFLFITLISSGQTLPENQQVDPFQFFTDTTRLPEGSLPRQRMRALHFLGMDRSDLDLLHQAERRGNQKAVAFISGRLGSTLALNGQTDSAITFFKQSQRTFGEQAMPRGEAAASTALGLMYERQKKFGEARDQFLLGLKKYQGVGFSQGMIAEYTHLARISEAQKDHTAALDYHKKALAVATNAGSEAAQAELNNKIAEELLHSGRDKEALNYLQQAYEYYEKKRDHKAMAVVLRNKGIVSYKNGNYNVALDYFQKSLREDKKLPALRMIRDTYLKLFATHRVKSDSSRANFYSSQYNLFRDSIEHLINSRALSPDSFTNELEEKAYVRNLINRDPELYVDPSNVQSLEYNQKLTEAELERLKTEEALARMSQERLEDKVADNEREDKIQQLEQEQAQQNTALLQKEAKQKQLIYLFSLSGGLVLFSLGFLMYRYQLKKKSHASLDKAYAELTDAHRKLKNAQEQLVHAEKMASLGQMTAGIAHEIQNPLNFVNNFSETSMELLQELSEAKSAEEREMIVNDLQLNLSKVVQHGRRAEGIVKNMLQHSRSGAGEKHPADLNKLAEEYLNLAFHGMRAKDSSFSCSMETDFDPNLPAIPMIAQDISRVLLNLYNNAFYAVNKKSGESKSKGLEYKAHVIVSTLMLSNYVTLTVRDNGTGISDAIRDKIFEPFFTTKPSGEGIGLGLSLSFDLIKAHGGEIKFESEEGNGSAFTFILPLEVKGN